MKTFHASVVCAVALVVLSSPALAAIQLIPVVTSGITSPTFVGHAGDGSSRLFILEQAGIVDVLQPDSGTPTMFLDIRSKVKSGGEQGLLGLAFHPDYKDNGRFFVFYTHIGNATIPAGTLVIAEYKVSSINPNVADETETIILTIPHPTNTNHNGGMLAFGTDGYLYIGVGDGGSANDPPNNAQNKNVLLGKILRIDINPPQGSGVPYVSPPDNPFYGPTDGLDEIFALGMRNPWRFSFDRLTGQQWVADVGQGSREEVDTPIVNGGNYGWRVYEGTACTNTDPGLCNPNNYIFPIFDYLHTNGRCSITGGYVYEGSLSTFPTGTYVYGDYCSGELLAWDGSTQSVLVDTALRISSFGEDEQGELYVVDLAGGSISRIALTPQCTYAISPTRATLQVNGGTGTVTVTVPAGCDWTAVSNAAWITITGGASGNGSGDVTYSVAPYAGKPRNRNGTMTIAGQTFSIKQSR
jgi:Glucose / Sorbosone dehydrogenase/Viral BACON domain